MISKLFPGDEVLIIDIHPNDTHYKKKDLFISKKCFIFAPPSDKWLRNKHMKEWLSLALKIEGQIYWFWGIKVEKIDHYFDNIKDT